MIKKYLTEMKSRGTIKDEKILQYIDDCVRELEKINFDNLFHEYNCHPTLDFDNINLMTGRTMHTFGQFSWGDSMMNDDGTLTLNDQMFNEPEESIKNTILHELCHYIVWKMGEDNGAYHKYNDKWFFGKNANSSDWSSHGKIWKTVANIVGNATGQTISRTNNYKTHTGVGDYARDKYKYVAKCKHCGREFKYARKGAFIQSIIDGNGHTDWSHTCNDGTKSHDFDLTIK